MNKGMKLEPLYALLKSLDGHDIDKMSEEEGKRFCALALDRFRSVAAPVPEMVLGDAVGQGYDWHVEACQFPPSDFVGSLKIVHTGQMERAIGALEKIRIAAALFPESAFEVALFGDFSREGGLQSETRLLITVSTDGRAGLQQMSIELKKVAKELAASLDQQAVIRTRVIAVEDACPAVVNPSDVRVAFDEVAKAARQAAKRQSTNGDDSVTERVAVCVEVMNRGNDAAECGEAVLRALGRVFVGLSGRQASA